MKFAKNKAYHLDLVLMSSYYILINTSSKGMDRSASVSDFIRLLISGKWYLVENNPIKYQVKTNFGTVFETENKSSEEQQFLLMGENTL